ncbi:MAG: fibronectin type III domain-containing protein, partial [Bacteroidota bacterium]
FTGNGTSASTATVDWTDASNNEGGFEIWRRRVTGPSTYTLWEMAKLTTADVTSLNDTGLEPSSTYQYKIRGVSSSGRSNYTPSSATQYLIINTDADTQIPSTPLNLTATKSGIREITLNWQASTDNTGIRQYAIFFSGDTVLTGTPTTSYKLTNLPLNTVFTFTVKAIDLGGNYSLASNSASSNSYVAGLYYEHSTGGWTDLDLIDWSVAEFKGTVNNFTLTPRTQEDYFNFEFDGYLYINLGGSYQFRTTSDDGSRLTLNNTVIVDNDGLHGAVTVTSGFQTLSAGPQLINVKFFEYTGGQSLTVQYRGPDTGFNWVNIPDAALKSGNPPPPAPSANNLTVAEESAELESKLPENALTLDVFPNPLSSSQTINVRLQTFQSGPVQVKLMDMVGKSFYENTFDASYLSEGAAIMPRETLNNGIYVIIANQGKNAVKQKVIIKD